MKKQLLILISIVAVAAGIFYVKRANAGCSNGMCGRVRPVAQVVKSPSAPTSNSGIKICRAAAVCKRACAGSARVINGPRKRQAAPAMTTTVAQPVQVSKPVSGCKNGMCSRRK